MSNDLPLLELFQALQEAGMKLTPEQYDLLRQALQQGYGLGGWDDLKRICQRLWVKPSPNYSQDVFEPIFEHFVETYRRQFQSYQSSQLPTIEITSQTQPTSQPALPSVPPRQMPDTKEVGEQQAPIAVQTTPSPLPPPRHTRWVVTPKALPLSLKSVQISWRSHRRPIRQGVATEVDLEATISRISQNGFFSEVVLRPEQRSQGELLLLIDDSDAMLPFRPALQPLITAVTQHHLTPAQLYRFTIYPDHYLYDWHQPFKAIPLTTVLSQLHRSRTVVWIVSDGGAATRTYSLDRQWGIARFLDHLLPCIHQLLWLNPLPPDRWPFTTAQSIAQALGRRMIPLDSMSLQIAAKDLSSDSQIQLWSLLPPPLKDPATI